MNKGAVPMVIIVAVVAMFLFGSGIYFAQKPAVEQMRQGDERTVEKENPDIVKKPLVSQASAQKEVGSESKVAVKTTSAAERSAGNNTSPQKSPDTNSYKNPSAESEQRSSGIWGHPDERTTWEFPTDNERKKLPECTKDMLTRSPVPLERITTIEPRGSTSPPEHAIPSSSTDTYIAVDTRGTNSEVPLYASGDIWITAVIPRTGVTSDPEDDVIHYALCKDVFGIVDHVKSLSPEIKSIVDNYKCPYGGKPGDDRCPILVMEPMKAGTLLGTVGRQQGNFNFGTWDLRHTNNFLNPSRYGIRSLHSTCPFDYFSESVKSQLTKLLERADKNCGTVEYDIAGTAQGEWFYGSGGNYMHGDWVNHLFLGYDNRFPDAAVISVGGVISKPFKWLFDPLVSGTKNVAFENVKDPSVYCYDNSGQGKYLNYEKGPTGRILLQLQDANSLKIEYQEGSCSDNVAFKDPKVYKR